MVMTLPIMYPVMHAQGFDPIWLGVVSVKLAEIGVLTPPVGLNVFVVKSSSPVPVTLGQAFTGVIPSSPSISSPSGSTSCSRR